MSTASKNKRCLEWGGCNCKKIITLSKADDFGECYPSFFFLIDKLKSKKLIRTKRMEVRGIFASISNIIKRLQHFFIIIYR